MDLDKKTKKAGGWNFFYEAKPTMGDRARHESFHDFYAPVEGVDEEQLDILQEHREKRRKVFRLVGFGLLAAVVLGFVIWLVIDTPGYFSFKPW